MKPKKSFSVDVVAEVNSGNHENFSDFIEYAYSIYRHNADEYEATVLQAYQFENIYFNDALIWLYKSLSKHLFSKYFIIYCIENNLLDSVIHWHWQYVQGLEGGIPIDSSVVLLEGDDRLLVWVEYGDNEELQPLAPFAELNYFDLEFSQTYRCDHFLIYTLSGFDSLRGRMINIELRVYNEKCRDDDGDVYYSDHKALTMADNYLNLFYKIKSDHQPELLTTDEIDSLLASSDD